MFLNLKLPRLGKSLVVLWFCLLPFEYIPTVEFHDFTVKLSYLVGLLLLVWGVLNLKPLIQKRLTISDKLLILFGLTGVSATLFGTHEPRNLIILALWGFMIGLYFVASRLISASKVEAVILIVTTIICFFGIYQFIGGSIGLDPIYTGLRPLYAKSILGFPRIHSVLLEPMYYANFLFIPFFFAIKKSFQQPKIINKYWWLAILVLSNIILTQSRGAFLALIISMTLLAVHWLWQKYYVNIAKIILIGILSVVFASSLILLNGSRALTNNFARHAVAQNSASADSVNYRFENYRSAYKMFAEKPLLGHGVGSFGVLTHREGFSGYDIVLNEYLEILAETGIVGLLLFLSFLVMLTYESWHVYRDSDNTTKRQTILYLALGLLAIFIQYNFFSTLYIIYIWAFLALLRSQSNKS